MVPVIMDEEVHARQVCRRRDHGRLGRPIEQPDHARRAVRAGLGMLQALAELQAGWRERGLPAFDIGIGINSGEAVAGNIGSRKRAQYTVIGDTVNTASRLESLNKEMGTRIIISEPTYRLVEDMVEVRLLPPVTVKGKVEVLHRLRGAAPQGSRGAAPGAGSARPQRGAGVVRDAPKRGDRVPIPVTVPSP